MSPATERLNTTLIREGMAALEQSRYAEASKAFSHALKFDPRNAHLHFLNGLAYHLAANAGDSSQEESAEVAYQMTLQFDPGNYWASAQLGHLRLRQQRYREAQDAFAYALLYDAHNAVFLQGLAVASYYSHDLETANWAVGEAQKLPVTAAPLARTATLVHAASGRFETAREDLAKYLQLSRDPADDEFLKKRIGEWQGLYQEPREKLAANTSTLPAHSTPPSPLPVPTATTAAAATPAKPTTPAAPSRMVIIDVSMIRSEEQYSTNKGVNLLSGLQLQFGGSFARSEGLTRGSTVTGSFAPDITTPAINSVTRAGTGSGTLTGTITLPTINYNLNIFNDNDNRVEVLARPTLLALEGQASEFFSGATLHVALNGAAGSQGTIQDVPIGVKLSVTPNFINDDHVNLAVSADREFFEALAANNATFSEFVQTSKTNVVANVVMGFDQTLLISGLSEREVDTVKDGVPILKDIPILQYFFSNKKTVEYTKSVLILLTPHRPRYPKSPHLTETFVAADGKTQSTNLQELKKRQADGGASHHFDTTIHHLRRSRLFTEFRTEDLADAAWSDPENIGRMAERALKFLYY